MKLITRTPIFFLFMVCFLSSSAQMSAVLIDQSNFISKPGTDQKINFSVLISQDPDLKVLPNEVFKLGLEKFLTMTPTKYKQLTGKKLGIKKSMELKFAQKKVKKQMEGDQKISKGLYIVMAIFALGWLAMGILDDWKGNDWWISLLLTFLCVLPGIIYSFVKMKKYYN